MHPILSVRGALAFGDSVLWGQGLRHENKFITRIARRTFSLPLPVQSVFAHSGAIIGDSSDVGQFSFAPDNSLIHPEVPHERPTIFSQVNSFGRGLPRDQVPDDDFEDWIFPNVRVVFLNGGINDLGASNLVSGDFGTLRQLARKVDTLFNKRFFKLLNRVRHRFPNAVLMTFGYHFVFSHLSLRKVAGLVGGLEEFISGFPRAEARRIREQFRRAARQGSWFMALSHAEHQSSVDRFNLSDLASGGPGCVYVPSLHAPEHASFAPETLSWDIGRPASISSARLRLARIEILDGDLGLLLPFGSADEVAAERAEECDLATTGVGAQATCKMAGLFHPNSRSAERVFRTAHRIQRRFTSPHRLSLTLGLETSLARYAARRGFAPNVSYRQMFATDVIGSVRLTGTIEAGSSGDFPYHLLFLSISTTTAPANVRLALNATLPFSDFFRERNKDLFPGAAGPLIRVGDIASVQDVRSDTNFDFFAYPSVAMSIHDVESISLGCDDVDGTFNISVRNLALTLNGRNIELEETRFNLIDGGRKFLYFA